MTQPSYQSTRNEISRALSLINIHKPHRRTPAVALCDEPGLSPCVMTGIARELTYPSILRTASGAYIQIVSSSSPVTPHQRLSWSN